MIGSLTPPGFWWEDRRGLTALVLSPLAAAYGAVAGHRMQQGGFRASVPIVCVGNFTVGGAGKTPMAMALAQSLAASGERPFLLTRGYRSAAEHGPPVRVDVARHSAVDVGDEALLLARAAPTLVSADRVASAKLAVAQGASVLILDDGLQNPALAKDLRIVVVDGATAIGNGLCLPAGPLRAPLSIQLAGTDALVILGDGVRGQRIGEQAQSAGKRVFNARLDVPAQATELVGKRVYAFAGIGRPEKFFATLAGIGAQLVGSRAFPDHHVFQRDEIAGLQRAARDSDAWLVTTEKDMARLQPLSAFIDPALPQPWPVPVELTLADTAAFNVFVKAGIVGAAAARKASV
jgi:tetraacyldisaccharide 4'-kinase